MFTPEYPLDISHSLNTYLPRYLRRILFPYAREGSIRRFPDEKTLDSLRDLAAVVNDLFQYGDELCDEYWEVCIINREKGRIFWLQKERFGDMGNDILLCGFQLNEDCTRAERKLLHFAFPSDHEVINPLVCSHLGFLGPVLIDAFIRDLKGGRLTPSAYYQRFEDQMFKEGRLSPRFLGRRRFLPKR